MSLNNNRFERYRIIDQLLKGINKEYPDMDKIISSCQLKLKDKPEKETIQKDLARMKKEYGAPIYYNRFHKGYEYTRPNYTIDATSLTDADFQVIDESIQILNSLLGTRFKEKFEHLLAKLTATNIERSMEEETRHVLQTMNLPPQMGFKYFDLLYNACKAKTPVSILHFSFSKRTHRHLFVHPFLVKEFDNRWYVIGYSESHRSVRTFGLDSITDPLLIKKRYINTPDETIDQYLNDMYGVIPILGATRENIEIEVDETGTHYFQSYKLHKSQIIEKHAHGDSSITYNLIPTRELAHFFKYYSRHIIKVIKPSILVNYMQNLQNE